MAVVLFAAVWFQTVAHTVMCHSDNALCGHEDDGCSTAVCVCVCHTAIEPLPDAPLYAEPRETTWVPASNETIRTLLLPNDIFRPPLANS